MLHGGTFHRLDGVAQQVQEHLLDLNRSGAHRGKGLAQVQADLNPVPAQVVLHHIHDMAHQLIEIHQLPLPVLLAHEVPDTPDNLGRPLRLQRRLLHGFQQ
ncbi:MAG: hypothetical protein WC383_11435, partial [Gammaproteobacteria bacterium]